jgi:hypothetical protein
MSLSDVDAKILIELLRELRQDQKDTSELLHKHTILLTKMQHDVNQNTEDLAEHMARTKAVEQMVLDHRKEANTRLNKLESIVSFREKLLSTVIITAKVMTSFGTIGGILYAIYTMILN